jgi:transketolase
MMGAQRYENVLLDLCAADDRLIILTAENRAAIRSLPAHLGPRFIDFGICEQTMVGAAAGLALRGRIPIVHALAAFLPMRSFEFVRTDVGIARLPVILVGGVPGFLSEANGPTHQAIEDIALMRGIPGMRVFCPADETELALGLPALLHSPGPTYIRFNNAKPCVTHEDEFLLGRAEILRPGGEVIILTYGALLAEVLEASEILARHDVIAGVVNMRCLQPADEATILAAAGSSRLLVSVEDHFVGGGLTTIIAETLVRHGVAAHLLPLALPQRWFRAGLLRDVLRSEGFTGVQIADRILSSLNRTNSPKDAHGKLSTAEPIISID